MSVSSTGLYQLNSFSEMSLPLLHSRSSSDASFTFASSVSVLVVRAIFHLSLCFVCSNHMLSSDRVLKLCQMRKGTWSVSLVKITWSTVKP